MSKTRHALWLYYLAVVFLTICAGVIVVKLVVFPPCAPQGNTCVVDPWSAAGLEGAVLGVSATVLAILGAVAVAAWWTVLNERVKDQVDLLYEAQQKAVNTQVDFLLKEQQKKIDAQISEFGTTLNTVQQDVKRTKELAEQANTLTKRASEILTQTAERSEQETEMLRQTHSTQKELLTSMQDLVAVSQQRAATADINYKRIDTLYNQLRESAEKAIRETVKDPEKWKALVTWLSAERAKELPTSDDSKDTHEG